MFLPGIAEITDFIDRVNASMQSYGSSADSMWLLPLHSSIPLEQQQRVFAKSVPSSLLSYLFPSHSWMQL